jgi:hypothetical protein
MTFDIIAITSDPENEISRSVTLTNEQWSILALCADSYAETYRVRHSQIIATYVTRGQLAEAQAEANRMNQLLLKLDRLQALIV